MTFFRIEKPYRLMGRDEPVEEGWATLGFYDDASGKAILVFGSANSKAPKIWIVEKSATARDYQMIVVGSNTGSNERAVRVVEGLSELEAAVALSVECDKLKTQEWKYAALKAAQEGYELELGRLVGALPKLADTYDYQIFARQIEINVALLS